MQNRATGRGRQECRRMLGDAIGDILPQALAVALSPIPIVAVILVLGTSSARMAGPAFAAGWIVGLLAILCGIGVIPLPDKALITPIMALQQSFYAWSTCWRAIIVHLLMCRRPSICTLVPTKATTSVVSNTIIGGSKAISR